MTRCAGCEQPNCPEHGWNSSVKKISPPPHQLIVQGDPSIGCNDLYVSCTHPDCGWEVQPWLSSGVRVDELAAIQHSHRASVDAVTTTPCPVCGAEPGTGCDAAAHYSAHGL